MFSQITSTLFHHDNEPEKLEYLEIYQKRQVAAVDQTSLPRNMAAKPQVVKARIMTDIKSWKFFLAI